MVNDENEPLIPPSDDDDSQRFKRPLRIWYYALKSCEWVEDDETGCTMPCEEFEIRETSIFTNGELLRLYEKSQADEVAFPIPLELQLMFAFIQACGGYQPKVHHHKKNNGK